MNVSRTVPAGGLLCAIMIVGSAWAQPGPPPPPPPPPPPSLPPVPVPPQNPITEPKRVLGKLLFWEEQLSSDSTTACGTCHLPGRAGADPRFAPHPGADEAFQTPDDVFGSFGVIRADDGDAYAPDDLFGLLRQVTPRSAPTFILSQYSPLLFWDGRASDVFVDPQTGQVSIPGGGALESQAVVPIVSDVEMAHEQRDWTAVAVKLATARPMALATDLPPDMAAALEGGPSYGDLFAAAFGDGAITGERIAFAIATYERTLVPDQTPWDLGALTPQQQNGFGVFLSPGARCSICHAPPFFTDQTFRNIGLRPPAEDTGRMEVTGLPQDRGRFKVPTLRNVGLKSRFMHNGARVSLNQVIDFYLGINGQIQFPQNQDPLIPGIAIPPQARPDLINFLQNGLTDPRVAAETFPFDRPTLHSETNPPNPLLVGPGTPGTGGIVPAMIAVCPPYLGNDAFKIGVDRALGGVEAFVAVSSSPPSPGGALEPDELLGPVVLESDGYATWPWPVPDDPALDGTEVFFQWRVSDPSAAGGVALSAVASATLFCSGPSCPPAPQCTCVGDLNCDQSVGFDDLLVLLGAWGPCAGCAADLDASGEVGFGDLLIVLGAWGGCP